MIMFNQMVYCLLDIKDFKFDIYWVWFMVFLIVDIWVLFICRDLQNGMCVFEYIIQYILMMEVVKVRFIEEDCYDFFLNCDYYCIKERVLEFIKVKGFSGFIYVGIIDGKMFFFSIW